MHQDRTEDDAVRAAYSHVMDGFAAALTRDGLPADERARLLRCHRLAADKAGQRPLVTATEDQRPVAPQPARTSDDKLKRALERSRRAKDVGGIAHLGLHYLTARPLLQAGIVDIHDLARRVEDGTLAAVPGIGAKRLEAIRAALAQQWTPREVR